MKISIKMNNLSIFRFEIKSGNKKFETIVKGIMAEPTFYGIDYDGDEVVLNTAMISSIVKYKED